MKKEGKHFGWRNVIQLLCIAAFFLSFVMLCKEVWNYLEPQMQYKELQNNMVNKNEMNQMILKENLPSVSEKRASNKNVQLKIENLQELKQEIQFQKLKKINKDVVGWLYLPETTINYPVVQTTNNEYYLNHEFNGTKGKAGTLFQDYRCQNKKNTIIFGHHMKDGSMFATLVKYKDKKFFDKHPYIYYITDQKVYVVRVFSAYETKSDSDAWKMEFDTQKEFQLWKENKLSQNDTSITKKELQKKQVITLSTCDYEFQDARFVVHGYIM